MYENFHLIQNEGVARCVSEMVQKKLKCIFYQMFMLNVKPVKEPVILSIQFKGKNIAEVLNMTIEEASEFFVAFPRIKRVLDVLIDVGLGYITLGQSAPTLSGGESQRIKLAYDLSKRSTGQTLYILDEPTTGLHFADVQKLLDILDALVEK